MPTIRDKWIEMSIREIWTQCKFALIAFDNLSIKGQESTDAAFSSAHSFLSHAANVSKLLKAKDVDPPHDADVIGTIVGVQATSAVHDRELRNHLEHYDERLKGWISAQGPSANIGTYNIGPKSMIQIPGMVFVTHYDPNTKTFTFVNKDFDLTQLAHEVRKIQAAADAWVKNLEASRRKTP